MSYGVWKSSFEIDGCDNWRWELNLKGERIPLVDDRLFT
jgi:hypothetical protein